MADELTPEMIEQNDECLICHDDFPDLDEATGLCEMCFEQTFGDAEGFRQ